MKKTKRDYKALVREAVALADAKQGTEIVVKDLRRVAPLADYMFVISCDNEVHVEAMEQILEDFLESRDAVLRSSEGRRGRKWIVMDYGDLIIHLFLAPVRAFYDFDRLWETAPTVKLAPKGESSDEEKT